MCKIYSRIFLIGSLFFLFGLKAHAQNDPGIGIGAELGFPSGNFAGISGFGIGTSVKVDLPISDPLAITLNGGVMNFFSKRNPFFKTQNFRYVPLKAGLKYILSEGFYAEAQLGTSLPLNRDQKTLFVWSPGLGNLFRLNGNNKIDLGIRYEAWTGKNDNFETRSINTKGFVGLRVAYVFGL